jgi:hypothetical protein
MVRALLAGTKTQARRVAKFVALDEGLNFEFTGLRTKRRPDGAWVLQSRDGSTNLNVRTKPLLCPYGQPGDRLWVREAFSGAHCMGAAPPSKWGRSSRLWYWADGNPTTGDWTRPKPGIHMPRWASRILLEVTELRVQRLQEINEADAVAEGLTFSAKARRSETCMGIYECRMPDGLTHFDASAVDLYRLLWDQINGAGSWEANPLVWAVSFKRLHP